MTSPYPPEKRPARVDELDGLRGLLALWVTLGHMCAWCGYWELKLPPPFERLWPVFFEAAAAVDTFIILSGFAITFLLYAKPQSWGSFMMGRVFRIYPAYLVCLALGIGSTFLTSGILETATWKGTIYFEWIRALAANESTAFAAHTFWHLTLINGVLFKTFLAGATGTILTPAWSITLEWQYYLVAPLVAKLAKSLWGLLPLAGVTYLALYYNQHHAQIWQNPQLAFFPIHLPLFLVGIGSYHLYAAWGTGKKSALVFLGSIAALIAIGLIPFGNPGDKISISNMLRHGVSLLSHHSIGLGIWGFVFGCILVGDGGLPGKVAGFFRAFVLHPWLQGLGKISFPLYLVHWPIIIGILATLLHFAPGISQGKALALLIIAGMPLILIAARFLHVFVEAPGMALGKKVVRRTPAVIQPEAAPGN